MPDPFPSSIASTILVWTTAVFLVLAFIGFVCESISDNEHGVPRLVLLWLLVCIIVFSPLRYTVLQLLLATSYPFQSMKAFTASILAAIYAPFVFGLLYAIGFGLPAYAIVLLGGKSHEPSKWRLLLASLLAPVALSVGSVLFFVALPFAAKTLYWLHPDDVMASTNGPATYYYYYAVEPLMPLQHSDIAHEVGIERMTTEERLRSHVATIYLSNKKYWYYYSKAHPSEYNARSR
ncbi:MAG: hypothetical protein ACF8GE_01640 [Phycisphaerales bacterium JB043]